MKIFVGSTNPVKINAVVNAASETWPEVEVRGMKVKSGVDDQPMSDEETRKGAINRAKEAISAVLMENEKNLEVLGVGLEGGVFVDDQDEMWSTVWVAVVDKEENLFVANGARFKVPDLIANPIAQGEEMGPVVAKVVGQADVRSKQGMIGVVTDGFIDRTEEYQGIVKMALGLWYGRNWHKKIS